MNVKIGRGLFYFNLIFITFLPEWNLGRRSDEKLCAWHCFSINVQAGEQEIGSHLAGVSQMELVSGVCCGFLNKQLNLMCDRYRIKLKSLSRQKHMFS